jgi:lipopolysaccharide/colanic/teichoic acid biosynthesis glycosyltransferase
MRTQDRLNHEIIGEYAHRHRVKPGITGWAQVNGCRGAISDPTQLQRRLGYDLYYIDNWSPILDLKILLLTVFRVFANENAY